MKRLTVGLLLGMLGWLSANAGHAQESMERALVKKAPQLIKLFKDKQYKNVGVLKFQVAHEGDTKLSDNVGTMNMALARQLETALLIANEPRTPIGIIENASDIASKIAGASHLNPQGRQKLLEGKYALPWGKDSVSPDAFITGMAQISKDLKKVTISLLAFDKQSAKLAPLGEEFVCAVAANRLSDMGESFVLRGAFDEGDVMHTALKVREQQAEHPAAMAGNPVTLEVYYDNKRVPVETRNGKAYLPEPQEGQSVHFKLSRDGSKERYAVVLKVNGENTLDRQRLSDFECSKWVLGPGGPWEIHGYQLGSDIREKFRVASVAESRAREMNYGRDVGTITMTVFRELKVRPRPKLLSDEEQAEKVVAKSNTFKERPNTFDALKAKLLDDANGDGDRSGGLIVQGTKEESKVETVSFHADPVPVMGWTIVYYQKKN